MLVWIPHLRVIVWSKAIYRFQYGHLLSDITVLRWVYFLGGLFFFLFGLLSNLFPILELEDPLIIRGIIAIFVFTVIVLTFIHDFFVDHIITFNKIIVHIVNIYMAYFLVLNNLSLSALLRLFIYIGFITVLIPFTFESIRDYNTYFYISVLELIIVFLLVEQSTDYVLAYLILAMAYIIPTYILSNFSLIIRDRIQKSDQRLEFIEENTPIIFFIIDKDGFVRYSSGSGFDNLSITPESLLGTNVLEDYSDISAIVNNVKGSLKGYKNRDYVHLEDRVFDTIWNPYRLNSGEMGLMGVSLDVTDHFITLRELQKTQQLMVENQKLEAAGKLASSISHDFNNILSIISLNNELIRSEVDSGNYEKIKRRSIEISKNVKLATYLTDRLRTLTASEMSTPEVIEINQLIQDQETMLKRVLKENMEIEFHYLNHEMYCLLDEGKLGQVLLNLVINSKDALVSIDGGKIDIVIDRVFIDQKEHVTISVNDNGQGMSETVKKQALEAFFTTKEQGSGLGLYSVQSIMHEINGKIDIKSKIDQGTTVTLAIPIVTDPIMSNSDDSKSANNELDLQNLSVLLVEDQQSLRMTLHYILKHLGCSVIDTGTAEEAMEIVMKGSNFDLIITDVVLTKMDGIEFADQVENFVPDAKIIFISGYSEKLDQQVLNTDKKSFLAKPFSQNKLVETINLLMN